MLRFGFHLALFHSGFGSILSPSCLFGSIGSIQWAPWHLFFVSLIRGCVGTCELFVVFPSNSFIVVTDTQQQRQQRQQWQQQQQQQQQMGFDAQWATQ